MTLASALVVFGAGLAAGLVNSVAGGGTLLSFPTLVWVGRDPIVANVTNAVALWPGSLASMIGFRRELRGGERLLVLLAMPSVLGALAGAALLLRTPSHTFAAIVPWLVLGATLVFAAQGPLMRGLRHRPHDGRPSTAWMAGAMLFQFFVALYGGYFGAGIGIIMLAALGLLGVGDILRMNGLKNAFAFCINAVAALYFALQGTVSWADALVLGAGAILGGYGGAGVARRVGRGAVRRAVIVIGLVMAASLALRRP
jgi:uncharacterized membrane protein YfcA